MKKSITQLIWISLFVSVIYNVQAQVCDGMPHAYRSTLDTCQNENYSMFVFKGEKVFSGCLYFEAGKKYYYEDGITLPCYTIWDFSYKDEDGNSIYLMETDSTKWLSIPKKPKFIVSTGDTLWHLSSSALAEGKLKGDIPYIDEVLSPIITYIRCRICNGSGKCHVCNGCGKLYIYTEPKKCAFCNGEKTCPNCNGQGKVLLVKSVKRTGGGVPIRTDF